MRRNEHIVSVKDEPKGQSGEKIKTGISGSVLQGNALTPEFYELIYEADPGAENDDYYVTSVPFEIVMHAFIARLLRFARSTKSANNFVDRFVILRVCKHSTSQLTSRITCKPLNRGLEASSKAVVLNFFCFERLKSLTFGTKITPNYWEEC